MSISLAKRLAFLTYESEELTMSGITVQENTSTMLSMQTNFRSQDLKKKIPTPVRFMGDIAAEKNESIILKNAIFRERAQMQIK